jgi:polyferredoxin
MKFQLKRYIAQLLFLISANLGALGLKTGFCYPFFYCHACPAATSACPLRAIEVGVFNGEFKWKLITYPLLILGTVGVLTGRAVCGWACPIGLLQRTTGVVPKKIKKRFPKVKKLGQHKIEPYLRYIKYVLLIALVIITPIFIGFMFTDICPTGILVGTIPVMILSPGTYTPNAFFYIALIIFILFFVLIFLIERGWCRYFCPVGAILAPFNKISFLHVAPHVMVEYPTQEEKCIHCNACIETCPMGIDVPHMKRDPECILCGKCIDACPVKIISFERV